MAREDNINVPALAVIALVSALLVLEIIIFISAWFHRDYQAEVEVKQVIPPSLDLRKATFEQQALLTGYRWVDQDKDVAAIPIERAMELVVRESGERTNSEGSAAAESSAAPDNDGDQP